MDEADVDVDSALDAAADLLLGDGIATVTFATIAGRIGRDPIEVAVAFDSLESLLVRMLAREYQGMFRVIADSIDRDPLGGLLSRIYRYLLVAVHERPLARFLYLSDSDALSTIIRSAQGIAPIPTLAVDAAFIDRMQEVGMVRRDVDPEWVSAVVTAACAGAAVTAPHRGLDHLIDGLVLLLERGVDTDATDTTAGKLAFVDYALSLAPGPDRR